jgi:hypothetical protein
MAAVPLVTAAVLLVASQIVYDRPALRVDMGTTLTSQLLIVLLLVIGLTLSATHVLPIAVFTLLGLAAVPRALRP